MSTENDEITDIPVFDTRGATKPHKFRVLTDDHPDGIVFTVRPLDAAVYLKVVEKSEQIRSLQAKGADGETLSAMQDMLYELITPLITPAVEFGEWKKSTKKGSGFVYRMVMDQVVSAVIPKVRVN